MSVVESIKRIIEKSPKVGVKADKEKILNLNTKLNGIIPEWYIEAITKYPFCNLLVGWKMSEPEENFDGVEEIQILDSDLLDEINCDSYPGIYLTPANYFVIGYGAGQGGNCFVIPTNEGNDPPIYEVWHDVAFSTEELIEEIRNGNCTKLSDKLSDFFNNAILKSA